MNADFLKKHEKKWFFISVFSVHLRPILKLSGG